MNEQTNMAARYEHEIPEGYEAKIEGNKFIIELKESEDERIRKEILALVKKHAVNHERCQMEAYLEKQQPVGIGEEKIVEWFKDNFHVSSFDSKKIVTEFSSMSDAIESLRIRLKSIHLVKQEWSEEDEKMLRTIISDGSRGVELDPKQIDWLKSLRSRPKTSDNWKPSAEQMEELGNAKDMYMKSSSGIASLYYDLITKFK